MDKYITSLRERILTEGVLDGEDIHHEFVSGMHGRKLDFDTILTASNLYEEWIDAFVTYIEKNYSQQPDAILGVANGANRLALNVAAKLQSKTVALITEKENPKSVKLTPSSADYIVNYKPEFVLVIEDVGTSGTSSTTAALAASRAGAKHVSVLNTWQRRAQLEKLEAAEIKYEALILEPLPTYKPENCAYCREGIKLIKHD